jgi:hypothetical protein
MARPRPLLTEAQRKKIAPARAPQGWPPVNRQPHCVGRESVDAAERPTLSGSGGEISTPLDGLAAGRPGGARRVAEHLAHSSQRVERAPAIAVERVVSGREFRSREKGGEVDGGGRRRGCSSGRPPSLCLPGGSATRGADARGDPFRTASSCGPTAAEAGAGDCRQSLRQRPSAEAVAAAWDRTSLPTQEESRSTGSMDPSLLYKSPFRDTNQSSVEGGFDGAEVPQLLRFSAAIVITPLFRDNGGPLEEHNFVSVSRAGFEAGVDARKET